MSTTSEAIGAILSDAELSYAVAPDGSYFLLPYGGFTVMIRVIEDGGAVMFQVPGLHQLEPGPQREACYRFMLDHNFRTKIGWFSCDDSDGEVRLECFLPLEDSEVTAQQVQRCVMVLANEARQAGAKLREVAAGKDPAEVRQVPSDAAPEAPPFDLASLPAAPVDEAAWLRLVVQAFGAECAKVEVTARVERMRTEVWPRLAALRDESAASGPAWLTPALARQHGLTPAEEYLVLFLLARHAAGDRRITYKEIDLVYSPGAQARETVDLAGRLEELAVIEAVDHDHRDPYRLSRHYLDPLESVLPFEYVSASAWLAAANVPAGPVSEPEWLALVGQLAARNLADARDTEAVELVHGEVWPALLALRKRSLVDGQAYATADRAAACELSVADELVVAYVAQRAAGSRPRVDLMEVDLIHSPGLDFADAKETVERLLAADLLASCDGDDIWPYTTGAAAAPWVPA